MTNRTTFKHAILIALLTILSQFIFAQSGSAVQFFYEDLLCTPLTARLEQQRA